MDIYTALGICVFLIFVILMIMLSEVEESPFNEEELKIYKEHDVLKKKDSEFEA